jgi:hypothetical protein
VKALRKSLLRTLQLARLARLGGKGIEFCPPLTDSNSRLAYDVTERRVPRKSPEKSPKNLRKEFGKGYEQPVSSIV